MRSKLAGLAVAWALVSTAFAQSANLCDQPGEEPDLIVSDVNQVVRWGTVGDITAYTLGNVHCNLGSCWVNWVANTNQHPVLAQNLFRLKDGSIEQLGQSWVMNMFFALSMNACSGSCQATDGSHLGVECSDTNSASGEGQQPYMAPKSDVDAASGYFPFPFSTQGQSGNAIFKRLQVHNADLDPAQNAGAQYFLEAQFVAADDAAADNDRNNVSYRAVQVTETSPGTYNLLFTGPTRQEKPAIQSWAAADPGVVVQMVEVPGDGSFVVAGKASDAGGGLWHYEYAIQNMTSHRSAAAFSVPLPFGANVGGAGFHDVDYHSGELYDGTDWAVNRGDYALSWSTQPFGQNPNANALRWGTLYNFRFDADVPPAPGTLAIGLFRPGAPDAVSVTMVAPSVCDGDGLCDPGEDCGNCPGDCANQGGGGGCCGDGTCDPGERGCTCLADCGPPASVEIACDDGADDDCDGLADCQDLDCCSAVACDGADADGDGYEQCDCNDADPLVWSVPGEIGNLRLARAGSDTTLEWDPPPITGAVSVTYAAIRAGNPANFVTSTACLPDGDAGDTTVADSSVPVSGRVFYYEVRAKNACPQGEGPLGRRSDGMPRPGRTCP